MKSNSLRTRIRITFLINLIAPTLVLALSLVMLNYSPMTIIKRSIKTVSLSEIYECQDLGTEYVELTVDTLYHTGQEYIANSITEGAYYYALEDGKCYFFLLSSRCLEELATSGTELDVLHDITIRGRLTTNERALSILTFTISDALNWSKDSLSNITCDYIVKELDFGYHKTIAIINILCALIIVSAVIMLMCILCILFPILHLPIIRLLRYGNPIKHLKQAENELSSNVRLRQANLIVTDNYFINLSNQVVSVIPLDKIIWAYRFSSYHTLRHMNRKITFTLCVLCSGNVLFKSPHLIKTDTSVLLSYLETNYPDILVGYSKEHEQAALKRARIN